MADIPASGSFKIVPLAHENSPIGVEIYNSPLQTLRVNASQQLWNSLRAGDDIYQLSVAWYPFTGQAGDNAVATLDTTYKANWKITRQDNRNAYTIALEDNPFLGWTVATNLAEGNKVALSPILPQFLPTQLFSFVKAE